MKTVTDTFDISPYRSKLFDLYFGGLDVAVFDIETTGLFPRNDVIMLSGILTISTDSSGGTEKVKATATQFFAEKLTDEKEVVKATIDTLSKAGYIVTYNGRSFDVPFLKARAAKYGLRCDIPYDFDLFSVLSGYSDIKKITGSLSQKSVEEYAGEGSVRKDRIGGYESIKLYERYLSEPSYALEKTILLHNHDDICQLYRILSVLSEADLDRAMFRLGYPAGDYMTEGAKISSGILTVNAVKTKDPIDYISFPTEEAPYSIRMNRSDGKTEIELPCEKVGGTADVLDAESILLGLGKEEASRALAELKKYPSFENGYLIVKNSGKINYLETNLFIKALLEALDI